MGEDRYDFSNNSKVLTADCKLCKSGYVDEKKDPYLKNVKGSMYVLEQKMKDNVEGMAADKAKQVLQLLNNIADAYWVCKESKPSRAEMRYYVILAIESVESARQESEKRAVASDAVPDRQITPLALVRETSPSQEFSIGTIERQLCNLKPIDSFSKRLESLQHPSPKYPVSTPCPIRVSTRPSPTSVIPLPATQEADLMNRLPFSLSNSHIARTSEEETIITNPSVYNPALPSSPFQGSSTPLGIVGKENTAYSDGRDGWECDFCGTECFCLGIND